MKRSRWYLLASFLVMVAMFAIPWLKNRMTPPPVQDPSLVLPLGHAGPVVAATCAPDGRWCATLEQQGAVKLWDLQAGTPFRTLPTAWNPGRTPHAGLTAVLAFSPDSRLLAVGVPGDTAVHLYDVPGGTPRAITHREGGVTALAFSPDGRYLAIAADDNRPYPTPAARPSRAGTVQAAPQAPPTANTSYLWVHRVSDRAGVFAQFARPAARVCALAFANKGTLLATGALDGTARVFNWQDGAQVARLPLAQPATLDRVALAFTHNDAALRVTLQSKKGRGTGARTVNLTTGVWDFHANTLGGTATWQTGQAWVSVASDAVTLLAGTARGWGRGTVTARAWTLLPTASGPKAAMPTAAALSVDGTRAVLGFPDGDVCIEPLKTGKTRVFLGQLPLGVTPDGSSLTLWEPAGGLQLWRPGSANASTVPAPGPGTTFTRDGRYLLTRTADRVSLRPLAAARPVFTTAAAHYATGVIAVVDHLGARALLAPAGGSLTEGAILYNLKTGRPQLTLSQPAEQERRTAIADAAFTPDGTQVVLGVGLIPSGGKLPTSGMLQLYNRTDGELVKEIDTAGLAVRGVTVSGDGRYVAAWGRLYRERATSADGNAVAVWELASGHRVAIRQGRDLTPSTAAFTPEVSAVVLVGSKYQGEFLGWGPKARVTRLIRWEFFSNTEVELGVYSDLDPKGAAVHGTRVICPADDGSIRFYDVASGRLHATVYCWRTPTGARWLGVTPAGAYHGTPGAAAALRWLHGDTLLPAATRGHEASEKEIRTAFDLPDEKEKGKKGR
jgi:WD40 repeat protein